MVLYWPESRLLCELPLPALQLDLEKVGSETMSVKDQDDLAGVNTVTFLCPRAEKSEVRGSFFPQISHKVLFFCYEIKSITSASGPFHPFISSVQMQKKHVHRGGKKVCTHLKRKEKMN